MNSLHYSKQIRLKILELCYRKKTSHIGGAFSVTDILSVLYNEILDFDPNDPNYDLRDRLFYSKGHACTALYAALELSGFFKKLNLTDDFVSNGSYFTSHINHKLPGIELSTGSLGHALGVSCGTAIALQRRRIDSSIFAVLSDGELDEGSNWEAIMFAAHNKLDNLTCIIDFNKIQSFGEVKNVMNLEPLLDKFKAFNWEVQEVNGHSHLELSKVFKHFKLNRAGKPKCVIAHTVKGKGVSFMEDKLSWHYKSPSDDEYRLARQELELL